MCTFLFNHGRIKFGYKESAAASANEIATTESTKLVGKSMPKIFAVRNSTKLGGISW